MSIIERVLKVIQDYDLTPAEFSRKIGIPRQSVTNWKNGQKPIPSKTILNIINEFPDIDARWLITGERTENNGIEKLKDEVKYHRAVSDFLMKQIEEKDNVIRELINKKSIL